MVVEELQEAEEGEERVVQSLRTASRGAPVGTENVEGEVEEEETASEGTAKATADRRQMERSGLVRSETRR